MVDQFTRDRRYKGMKLQLPCRRSHEYRSPVQARSKGRQNDRHVPLSALSTPPFACRNQKRRRRCISIPADVLEHSAFLNAKALADAQDQIEIRLVQDERLHI